eukprot:6608311-Prymnesium_polylepis.1
MHTDPDRFNGLLPEVAARQNIINECAFCCPALCNRCCNVLCVVCGPVDDYLKMEPASATEEAQLPIVALQMQR